MQYIVGIIRPLNPSCTYNGYKTLTLDAPPIKSKLTLQDALSLRYVKGNTTF